MNAEKCSVYVVSSVIVFLYKLYLYKNISIKNNIYKIYSKNYFKMVIFGGGHTDLHIIFTCWPS